MGPSVRPPTVITSYSIHYTKLYEAIGQFGLEGMEHRHPYQLSLGQKRRLSVAGATVLNKSVLLLDEPTFGQDAVSTFTILSLCEELRRQGTAIVMITHEEKLADTIATLEWRVMNGQLVERRLTKRGETSYNFV